MRGITINSLTYVLSVINIDISVGKNPSTYLQFDIFNGENRSHSYAIQLQADSTLLLLSNPIKKAYEYLVADLNSNVNVPDSIDSDIFTASNIDYTELDKACENFRNTCNTINALLPESLRPFHGGFDEIALARQYMTAETLALAVILLSDDASCNHEANKVGMQSPKWWYRCWGL